MKPTQIEFLTKLKDLLQEYDASIEYESEPDDWHSFDKEAMIIYIKGFSAIKFDNLCEITASDIQKELED